jgi:lipopolysaccharide transport system ATP-binding protein
MSALALSVSNIGKSYSLVHRSTGVQSYQRLSESIVHLATAPLRWLSKSSFFSKVSVKDEFWALRDVSFEVKTGDVVGIIGRNGAGKSTLLKILSRVTDPSTGRIVLNGRVSSLLEVGTGFHPELTGRENIYLNGAILGMTRKEIKARFDEIVEFAEIERFLDTPVKRYSSGMYVRLAFAVAAHLEPEILIVDEILAVGDAKFQKKCIGKMQNVASSGRTVILVSHQMDLIKRLATVGVLLEQGRLSLMGEPDRVIEKYLENAGQLELRIEESSSPCLTRMAVDSEYLAKGGLKITVCYASPTPISKPTLGLVVYDPNGAPVFGSNTLMHPSSSQASARSDGTVTFTLQQAPLVSGEYSVSFWLNDGYCILQHLGHALTFTFQDSSPPEYHTEASIIGYCRINPTWSFQ